ncbi:hypothetical protein Caka_1705 [Coraliomargarita akajimensis DSM 45221]|uniref:Uncharacterized protein n=1 Tax=Coraliomargarita akajimensis (strain DSM 45221 / IAM 15411 / JCM 23193 / KCTC 12865 / 04OKA010-24) TaxID=583355 RepID=D5EJX5_CORAD|nr:hypothetical protein Caka_1705 [Coraliomargarita akajimensis DSM 45221]
MLWKQTDAMIEEERLVTLTQFAERMERPAVSKSFCRTSGHECPLSGGCSLLSTASLRNTPMMRTQASVINPIGLTTFAELFNQTSDHGLHRIHGNQPRSEDAAYTVRSRIRVFRVIGGLQRTACGNQLITELPGK